MTGTGLSLGNHTSFFFDRNLKTSPSDAVVEEAKFSAGKTPKTIRDNLIKKATELRLPVERQMITVDRRPRFTRIRVEYELSVEWLPGKEYWWDVDEVSESVLF